jgi:hypothetical protein
VRLFLGWTEKTVDVGFANPPRVVSGPTPSAAVRLRGLFRRVDTHRQPPRIVFTDTQVTVACPVTVEVNVSRILTCDEFRRHCDKYKTRSAIIDNLE